MHCSRGLYFCRCVTHQQRSHKLTAHTTRRPIANRVWRVEPLASLVRSAVRSRAGSGRLALRRLALGESSASVAASQGPHARAERPRTLRPPPSSQLSLRCAANIETRLPLSLPLPLSLRDLHTHILASLPAAGAAWRAVQFYAECILQEELRVSEFLHVWPAIR